MSRLSLASLLCIIALSPLFASAAEEVIIPLNGPTGSQSTEQKTTPQQQGSNIITGERDVCGAWSLTGWAGCLAELLFWISGAMGVVLGIIGIAFNYVVSETIINMSLYVNDTVLSAGILTAWGILRDIGNIVIIGGLVFIALGTIFGLKTYNSNLLAGIIIAAILINFSYFITAVIIDATNILATELYKSSVGTPTDISSDFMQGVKLEKLSSEKTFNAIVTDSGNSVTVALAYAAMLIVFYGVTIYVLLNALVLLIARFVSLTLILISSPLGIVGRAIPYFSKYADMWWKALTTQALFAPIFFLLIGIAFKIQEGIVSRLTSVSSAGISSAITKNTALSGGFVTDISTSLLTFSIASMFMYLALRIARGMSAEAGELKPVYDFFSKRAGNISSFVGRNTIGALSNAAYQSNIQKGLESVPILGVPFRTLGGVFRSGSNAKFGGTVGYSEAQKKRGETIESQFARLGETKPIIQRLNESEKSFRKRLEDEKKSADKRQALYATGKVLQSEQPIWGDTTIRAATQGMRQKIDARKLELLIGAWDKNRKNTAENEFPTLNAEVVAILNKHNITMSKDLKKLHEDLVLARKDANNKALTEKERIGARAEAERKMQEIETEENSIQKKYSDTIAKLDRDIQKSQDGLRSGGAVLPERQREFLVKEVDRLRTEKSQSLDMQREYEHAKAMRDSTRDIFAKPPEFK